MSRLQVWSISTGERLQVANFTNHTDEGFGFSGDKLTRLAVSQTHAFVGTYDVVSLPIALPQPVSETDCCSAGFHMSAAPAEE